VGERASGFWAKREKDNPVSDGGEESENGEWSESESRGVAMCVRKTEREREDEAMCVCVCVLYCTHSGTLSTVARGSRPTGAARCRVVALHRKTATRVCAPLGL